MTKPYKTQPGTVAHRAVQYLKTLDPAAQLSTADFAEKLDTDATTLSASLGPARKAGFVNAVLKPGSTKLLLWSLGENVPADDEDVDEPLHGPAGDVVKPGPMFPVDEFAEEIVEKVMVRIGQRLARMLSGGAA